MSALARATATQLRVIGALMLRDLVSEAGSGTIPFLRVFLRPTLLITAFYLIGRAASGFVPSGFPLLVFVVTGYLTWLGFIRCFSGISIRGSTRLLMFPHVTPLDLVLGKMAVELVVYTVVFIGFCALGMLFEQAAPPADPLGVILAFWSAIGLGITCGMIASSVTRFTTLLDDLFSGIRLAGHALSGVFALATDTPNVLLQYLQWNPLFHAVEWMRESWWSSYKSPIADPLYILKCLFFLMAIGLAFERSTRRWQSE